MNWHWMLREVNNMAEPEQKPHLFDKPRNVSLLIRSLYAICILLFILDFILQRHINHSWENLPGFYAIFGFVAYVTIVLTAKQLQKILKRKEDYYDVDD